MDTSITALIAAAQTGERSARDALFAALYAELRRIAQRELSRMAPGTTLGPSTLLHEAYLQLSHREGARFPDRARFMGYAARVMRGLIVDYIRNRRAQKRGGMFELTPLDGVVGGVPADHRELARVSEALDELDRVEPMLAEIVDLKFFCGFSFAEVAGLLGISERTVYRQWERARIFLYATLGESSQGP